MTDPYWQGDGITLYLGDCREVAEWLEADALVTDPPYGIGYDRKRGTWANARRQRGRNPYSLAEGQAHGISGDNDTLTRDAALLAWGDRPAIVFGDLRLAPPSGTKQVLLYRKAPDSGTHGATGGFRRDIEAIYLLGPWPSGIGGRSSVIETSARVQGSDHGIAARAGHPHAKPVDVMETLIAACPPGTIADPFAGSGSTLIAARNQGRSAIGVEIDERYAERAARRLDQGILVAS